MELLPVKSWKHEFARSTEAERYREIVRRHKQDDQRRQKEKDEKEHEERADDLADFALVMASEADIDAYLMTTAHYQSATYEAIIENEQLLIDVRRERQEMLDQAYVTSNGRRVFKSEDGIRVFDEYGMEVDSSDVSADEIDDWRPAYEPFEALGEQEALLAEEQAELLLYQAKIDTARERLESGEISQKDFDAMKKDLADSIPDRIRDNLPEEYQPERANEQSKQLELQAAPLSRPGPMPGS